MLNMKVVGAVEVQRRLRTAPAELGRRIGAKVQMLGLSLERRVKLTKLAGQVLHRRSGRLVRSINTRFTQAGDRYESSTGTSLSYGRAWELGFQLPARVIRARLKKALSWPGASHPVTSVTQPARREKARPFLRPALQEMKPLIRAELSNALRGL